MRTRSLIARLSFALLAVLVVAAWPASAGAAPKAATPDLIGKAVKDGRIKKSTGDLYLAYAFGEPRKLPAAYRSDAPWDGTLPLLRLRQSVARMDSGPQREAIEEALKPAPPSGGPSCDTSSGSLPNSTSSTHFYVQYGTIGAGLSIAAYTASLEGAWTKQVDSFGWAAPPVAPTPAPGSRYHVRIDALGSGLYGYVSPGGTHAGFVGNNSNTAWSDGDAYASCMVLNSNYSGFPSTPQASLDSTTAHELNHSLQFGYGGLAGANTPEDAFVEGGATWMEDEVYDGANDNYFYLWPAFGESMGQYTSSPYPYWVTFRGLTERYGTGTAGGGEQVMQDFWEETSKNSGNNLTAMQTAMVNKGTTLADAYHAYAIAVKFNRACGGGYVLPHCFEEGPGYVSNAGATAVNATIASVGGSATRSVRDNYALDWVALPSGASPYNVTLSNTSSGGQLRGTVVCDTGSSLALTPLSPVVGAGQATAASSFNPAGCSSRVAVITNQSQTAANPGAPTARSYQLTTAAPPPSSFPLTVSRTGSGSGAVTSNPAGIDCGADCAQDYAPGTGVTLTATAASGSRFTGWSGACSGSASTCTVTMSTARSVTANFVPTFDLTVDRTGSGAGTITSSPAGINCGADCSQTYDSGTVVTLTATPAAGSRFTGWSGGGCSGTGTCIVTMSGARSVSANFVPTFGLTVSKAGTGSGTVTSVPAGVNCGTDCSETYDQGTSVTLTANPAAGSTFTGWSGACSGSAGTCSVNMDVARSVTATFAADPAPPPTFTLTVGKVGSGTVTSAPAGIDCGIDCTQSYDSGTSVTLTATAAPGSMFAGWSGACSGTGPCTVTMDAARNVTATFELPPPRYELTVSRNGTGNGAVTSSPAGINCGADCTQTYDSGTSVTLSATPAAGSSFGGWAGEGCSGTGNCTVTMDAARNVTATFNANPSPPPPAFGLTVTRNGLGSGTVTSNPSGISCGVDCSESYSSGTPVSLTASPAPGSTFAGWGGACAGTGSCTVTMSSARSVTATFSPVPAPPGENPPVVIPTSTTPAITPKPLPDVTRPVIALPRLSATVFRAVQARASAAVPVGTTVRYRLSEASVMTFRVERFAGIGRKVGSRCVALTSRNRELPRCARFVLLRGQIVRSAAAGAGSLRFTGRLAGRALVPGRYRLVLSAADRAGNRSLARRLSFRIVR